MRNVHFRYEDYTTLSGTKNNAAAAAAAATAAIGVSTSVLAASSNRIGSAGPSSSAFAMGLTIGELVAHTTDARGEVKFVSGDSGGSGSSGGGGVNTAGGAGQDDPAAVTHKVVHLRAGAIYWNSAVAPDQLWQHLTPAERVAKISQEDGGKTASSSAKLDGSSPSPDRVRFDSVLHPLDMTMRAVAHHGDDDRALLQAQEAEQLLNQQAHAAAAAEVEHEAQSHVTSTSERRPLLPSKSSSSSAPSNYFLFSFTLLSFQLRSAQYRNCVRILEHFSHGKVNRTIALRMATLLKLPPEIKWSRSGRKNGRDTKLAAEEQEQQQCISNRNALSTR